MKEALLFSLGRLKLFWQNLPRKFKIIGLIFFCFLMLTSSTFALFNLYENGQLGFFKQKIGKIVPVESDGFVKLQIPQREPPFFTLSPASTSKHGILPQEIFILKAKAPVTADLINESLQTTTPVRVVPQNDQEFQISPQKSLGLDQDFKIKLLVVDKEDNSHKFDRNYAWAFQTQGKFRVTGNLPGDKATNVPLNAGIEIVFSQDDFQDPSAYVKLEPSIAYRSERHAETLAIVPEKPLLPKTVYKVTLKKGLNLQSRDDSINEDYIFSFQTGEEEPKPVRMNLGENFLQVSPAEPMVVNIFTSNLPDDVIFKTKIYQFPSSSDFLTSRKEADQLYSGWSYYYAGDKPISTDGLSLVAQADLKKQSKEGIDYLQLPDTLPQAFYLVQFWYDNGKKLEQLWLQSTNLSGYVSLGRKQTVIWANNIEDGYPASQARVSVVDNNMEFATNDQGIVIFDTPKNLLEERKHYLEITDQEQEKLILPVETAYLEDLSLEKKQDYWSYLYQERQLYKPTDQVFFWGVIKNRDSNQAPSTVKVILSKGGWNPEAADQMIQTITPSPDGSFLGSFKLVDIPQGWYYLKLVVEGVEVAQSSFRVIEYVKPEMKIEVEANKKAIFTDEKLEFKAKVKFFDGTPASRIPLKIHEEISSKETEITTSRQGEISYTYQPSYNGSYYPHYETITINPSLAQSSLVEGYGSVYVYGSKLMITTKTGQDENHATLEAAINHVDLEGFNKGLTGEVKGKPASLQKVSLKIIKQWWERVEKGTYYDFIEKTTRPSYEYVQRQETVTDSQLATNNNGEISYSFDLEENKSYQAEISVNDSDNHPTTKTEYFYYYKDYGGNYQENKNAQLQLSKKENIFSIGEKVEAKIALNNKDYPDNEKNRFLFILAQRGQQETIIQEEPTLNFAFENKHIPNISIAAVIFTGRYYQTTYSNCRWGWSCGYGNDYYYDRFGGLPILYKKEDSQLDLEVLANQEKYRPGQKAQIRVKVSKNQTLWANSRVNITLVDEALETIGGIKPPNILPSLYKPVASQIYLTYYSHRPIFGQEPAAEMGGGGGEREIFKDTAFFAEAVTDGNGEASFEFQLPDNITTWLVYTQAVTENLLAGQSKEKLIVSQNFFITTNYPSEFLEKDKPFITGNSFGVDLGPNAKVDYKAIFYKGEEEKDKNNQWEQASKPVDFSFPALSEGDYKVSLWGKAQNLEDGILMPFQVIKTRLAFEYQKVRELSAGQELVSLGNIQFLANKPVRLVVTDLGKGKYYHQLANYCYSDSNRLERKLAKEKAVQILKESFDDESCTFSLQELATFQQSDGGLSQVFWGGSNLETSTWGVFVDSEPFDKEKLAEYFEKKLKDTQGGSIQKIQAAWGMTILGKPAINQLRLLADQAVTYQEKILTALALASAGETEKAREMYFDILADYAYANKPYLRIQADSSTNTDDLLKNTSLTLLLGEMVEPNYNLGFSLYLRDYKGMAQDIVLDLAEMSFLREELKKMPSESTQIAFHSPVKNFEKDLTKDRSAIIDLSSQETENFKLKVVTGKAEVATNYFVGPEGFAQLPTDDRLKINRTFQKAKGTGEKIYPGDIVKVEINFDLNSKEAPLGAYTVTDFLPSGLTYFSNPSAYGLNKEEWVTQTEKNIIKYTFYNSPWWQKYGAKRIVYYARVNAVGTYIAEPAIIQSGLDLSVFQKTSEEEVKADSPSTEEI
ncbi:MAG: alpha-2-macroglobulin family protein [bacterium]|nr:alpha-2-macroglobulin family protein [bacterium]